MKYAVTTIIISCVLLSLCYSSESKQKITQETKEKLYACGYNSLYLFLKLQGVNVSINDVKSQVSIGENGTSFYDLKIASGHLGIAAQVVECSYSTLQQLSFPCIAWIDRSLSGRENSQSIIGHFVVLLSCTPDEVVYLDGTSGQKTTVKATIFIKQWNGMLLVPESQLKKQFYDYFLAVGIFIIGILCLSNRFFRTKKSVPVLITVLFLSSVFVEASEITPDGIWRTRENEAANGLYLLLRSYDIPCDYQTIRAEAQSNSADKSLKDVQRLAKKHGLLSDVYFCQSVSALEKISLPFLLHTGMGSEKESSLWNGNFLLVIGRGHKHFMVIDCGTVQLSEITEENLRRYWSGYVLAKTPERKTSFVFSPMFFSGMIGLGILFLYLGFATQQTKSKKNKNTAVLILVVLCSGIFASQSLFAENPPEAKYSADEIKQILLETANAIKSLRVTYRSEYYTNPDAPKGTYLYRKILAMSPYFLNHTNSHPCDLFSWDNDPLLQQAFIQKEIGYNIFPFCSVYFVMKYSPNDSLPGTLPGEFFFNATGIWPMEQRKAPTWEEIPVSLRDIANHPEYNHVRPLQEKFDDRWCHVLSWSEHDTLWLDMERGGVLVARETFHPKTGVLMQRYELSRHEEVAPKIWIPKKLRNIQFDFSAKTEEGQKRRVIDGFFDVEEIEVNTLSESDFDFTPPAGALLTYDAQNPNAKYPYQSVTGGEELLDRLANWIRTMNPHKQIKVTTNNIFGWFVGGFVVPIIIFLEIRKRKKKR